MNAGLKTMLATAGLAMATQAMAQVTFYEHERFEGRSYSAQGQLRNFERAGFNDRASSAIVRDGRWEVCEHQNFEGRCVVLRPGRYSSLAAMGLDDRVSSVRAVGRNARVDDARYAPPPAQDYGRRRNEKLYEADVLSVRAVVGPPEQRCWTEREQVVQERERPNVGGAVAGALIGGILGHQIGGGTGKDIATAGGVVAGAAIGANAGRDRGGQVVTQNVQRCASVPGQSRPEYWDVIYSFRGQQHRMQTTTPPGATVTVNRDGEPRV